MTCICEFKTKKDLKEHVERENNFFMEDPSIFKPFCGTALDYLESVQSFCITNHPKRSWFASVKLVNGKIKVS